MLLRLWHISFRYRSTSKIITAMTSSYFGWLLCILCMNDASKVLYDTLENHYFRLFFLLLLLILAHCIGLWSPMKLRIGDKDIYVKQTGLGLKFWTQISSCYYSGLGAVGTAWPTNCTRRSNFLSHLPIFVVFWEKGVHVRCKLLICLQQTLDAFKLRYIVFNYILLLFL